MQNLKILGKQLRLMRMRTGMSLEQFAPNLDIEPTYLSKIENGLKKPSPKVIKKIQKFLGLSNSDVLELSTLAGHERGIDFTKDTNDSAGKTPEINPVGEENRVILKNAVDVQVPAGTHVLYTDSAFITSGQFGIVFDFAQSLASTPQNTVVARIGMSIEHAKALHKILGKKIIEAEKFRGEIKETKKND